MSEQPTSSPDPIEDAASNDDADMTTEMTPVPHEHRDAENEDDESESRWVLLSATGQRDTMLQVLAIGIGIALLLGAIHSVVRSLTVRGFARPTRNEERAIAAGLAALLGLVLTRVTVGARVAFFDPFLERGIETAVGLCAAIAVVVVGLLTWKTWLPPFEPWPTTRRGSCRRAGQCRSACRRRRCQPGDWRPCCRSLRWRDRAGWD